LSALDVLNISVSGFVLVFIALAILFGFIKLMVWALAKFVKQN